MLLHYLAILGDVMGDFEVPMGTASLGVDNSLRDPLPVEVGHLIQQHHIFQEQGASGSYA